MNFSCLEFAAVTLEEEDVRGKRVLEVGARNVNGTLRPTLESWGPTEYIGIDIEAGPRVDKVLDARDLVAEFGTGHFDLVVCTETLEHVRDWRAAVSNMKRVCKKGGLLLVTAPSRGFGYHAYPHDFWRYERVDMREIFRDFDVLALESDPADQHPIVRVNRGPRGVFMKARKPEEFGETDLSAHRLYSMLHGERRADIGYDDLDGGRYQATALWAKLRDRLSALRLFAGDRVREGRSG